MMERKERLAAVRAELDKQRAEMERRLADLEAYRAEVEKARDDALAAAERARQDAIADAQRWRAEVLAAAAAAGNTSPDAAVRSIAFPKGAAIPKLPIPAAPKALKEMKAPKWDRTMERLDVSDEELMAGSGRPRWMLPAGAAALVIILISAVYGLTHRATPVPDAVQLGNTTVVAGAADSTPAVAIPRGGFLTQPTADSASTASTAPVTSPLITPRAATAAAPTAARIDSAAGAVPPSTVRADSVAAARRRTATPPVRRRPTQEEIDSVNTAPAEWERMRRADSVARAVRARRDSIARRRDTLARRDSIRPDTSGLRMRPDTLDVRR
jgi:hypothetical protein